MNRLLRMWAIGFMILCMLTAYGVHAWGVTETQLKSQGILPALREYCSTFTLGQVKSLAAIAKIDNPEERRVNERELANADQFLKDLALFCRLLRTSDLSVQQKVEVLGLLSDLRAKVLRRSSIATGNVELACAISMLASGVFFDLYSNADEATRVAAIRVVDGKEEISRELVRDALKADPFVPAPGQGEAASGDEVIKLVFGAEALSEKTMEISSNVVYGLSRELLISNRLSTASFMDLLHEPDPKWLEWDLIWACRLRALCRLSLHLPSSRPDQPDAVRREFNAFRAAFSNELSESQRHVTSTSFSSASSDMQRDVHLLIEIQEQVRSKGQKILAMLCRRLEGLK